MTVRRKRRNARSGMLLAATCGAVSACCIGMLIMVIGII